MNLKHLTIIYPRLVHAAAKCSACWVLLATLMIHHARGREVPEPVIGASKAETSVTMEFQEPTVVLLLGPAKITAPVLAESPLARLDLIRQIKNNDGRQELLTVFGIEMGKTQPQHAMQMVLTEFQTLHDRQSFCLPMMRQWAEKQPLQALEACLLIPEGERRAMAYSATLAGWAAVTPSAAAAWTLENLSGIYRRTAITRIGKVWACTEPRKAANWTLTNTAEIDLLFSLSEVLASWADTSAQDAAEWAMQLPAGKLRDFALSKTMFTWADYFPKIAAEWLVAHPEDLWLLPRVAARWGQHDPAAASAWLEKNVSAAVAQESRQAMVLEWAEYNPRVAFEWAATALKGATREITFLAMFSLWASEYPQEARLAALELTDESERHNALASVFGGWSELNLEAFTVWLKQQTPSIEKDIGLEQLADVLIVSNPATALSEILTMQDQARVKCQLTLHFQDWKLTESQAAEAWLKQHPKAAKLMMP
jgi:hypothetical protein